MKSVGFIGIIFFPDICFFGIVISGISPETLSPIKDKTGKGNYFNFINTNQSNKIDFNPNFVATSKTKNNLSDNMSLSSIIEPKITIPKKHISGKKMMPMKPTDFTRVGYGSDCTIYDKKTVLKKIDNKTDNYIDDCINRRIEKYVENSREEASVGNESKNSFYDNSSYSDLSVLTSTTNSIHRGFNKYENNRDIKINVNPEYNPNVSTDSIKTSISKPYVGYDDKIKREEKRKLRYDRTCVNLEYVQRREKISERERKKL